MSTEEPEIRALVVEDDDGNRLLLSRFLTREGFEVEAVVDGPGALQSMSARPPDVVVLDLGLPGLDGIEVLRRIRRDSGIPVLVLSGRDDEPTKLSGFEVGADDYVVKPYSLPEIGARLPRSSGAGRRCRPRSSSSSTRSRSTPAPRSRRSTASRSTSARRSSRCSPSSRRRPGDASPARSCSSTCGDRRPDGSRPPRSPSMSTGSGPASPAPPSTTGSRRYAAWATASSPPRPPGAAQPHHDPPRHFARRAQLPVNHRLDPLHTGPAIVRVELSGPQMRLRRRLLASLPRPLSGRRQKSFRPPPNRPITSG